MVNAAEALRAMQMLTIYQPNTPPPPDEQLAADTWAYELASLNPEHPDRVLALAEIAFMARVIWASQ